MGRRTLIGTDLLIEQTTRQAFNLDTILLADFVVVPYKSRLVLDLGTGAGALMLYLSKKTKAQIIGIELQDNRYQQALNNIAINHLTDRLSVLHQDIRTLKVIDADCIVSNPPFFKVTETSNLSLEEDDQLSRHEIMLNLDDLFKAASRALRFGGHFFMIHRPDRFAEITKKMTDQHLTIKRVRFVHPYKDKPANHVLIEAVRNGSDGMVLEPPLILYESKTVLSEEMISIYGGRSYASFPTQSKGKTEVS